MGGRIHGYLFDAYGTLVKIREPRGVYARLFASSDLNEQQCRQLALTRNLTLRELANELHLVADIESLEKDLSSELESIEIIDGLAIETLYTAIENGQLAGVISNLAKPYAAPVIELLPPMENYVWSFEIGMVKPDPRIFMVASEMLGLDPKNIQMMGDSYQSDILGAQAVGMQTQIVGRTHQ